MDTIYALAELLAYIEQRDPREVLKELKEKGVRKYLEEKHPELLSAFESIELHCHQE